MRKLVLTMSLVFVSFGALAAETANNYGPIIDGDFYGKIDQIEGELQLKNKKGTLTAFDMSHPDPVQRGRVKMTIKTTNGLFAGEGRKITLEDDTNRFVFDVDADGVKRLGDRFISEASNKQPATIDVIKTNKSSPKVERINRDVDCRDSDVVGKTVYTQNVYTVQVKALISVGEEAKAYLTLAGTEKDPEVLDRWTTVCPTAEQIRAARDAEKNRVTTSTTQPAPQQRR